MPSKKSTINGHSRSFDLFNDRKKYYEDLRRKRNEATIELRKSLRDEQITKHRSIVLNDIDETEVDFNFDSKMTLDTIKRDLLGNVCEQTKLNSLKNARKMLSSKKNAPIDDFINAGILPMLLNYLTSKYNDKTDFQYECAWILTNIASGSSENTFSIVNVGAVPFLINLLKSSDVRVMEQTVWALGNIAGDGPQLRDIVLSHGIMPILIGLLKRPLQVTVHQNIVWTVSNLCRSKTPPPDFSHLLPCIPILVDLLSHTDPQVISNVCWALSYLTDGSNEKIQVIIEAGTISKMLHYLKTDNTTILIPALRVVGNVVSGNDLQTKHALDLGVLQYLPNLLTHKRIAVVKDAAWLLSNVLAGSIDQIQAVIDHNLLPILKTVLQRGDVKVQKEAAWAINNLFSGGTVAQKTYLLNLGILEPYCGLLLSSDSRLVEIILEGLNQLLEKSKIDDTQARVCMMIEEASGLDHLEAIQNHDSQKIYAMSFSLVEKYFQGVDDDFNELNFDFMSQNNSPSKLFSFDS